MHVDNLLDHFHLSFMTIAGTTDNAKIMNTFINDSHAVAVQVCFIVFIQAFPNRVNKTIVSLHCVRPKQKHKRPFAQDYIVIDNNSYTLSNKCPLSSVVVVQLALIIVIRPTLSAFRRDWEIDYTFFCQ